MRDARLNTQEDSECHRSSALEDLERDLDDPDWAPTADCIFWNPIPYLLKVSVGEARTAIGCLCNSMAPVIQ
jgi:hypothetical protein